MDTRTIFESAIVRLLTKEQEPIGIGMIVDANHIVTCAHVVNEALNRELHVFVKPANSILINPLFTSRDYTFKAQVEVWDYDSDIAVLEFSEQLPVGVTPQLMLVARHLSDHDFDTYGVPASYDDGIWTSGVLRSSVSGGKIQIEDTNNVGHFVSPGFSGAPIWDKVLGAVVGIVATADRDMANRTAFIIPTERVRQIWSTLPSIVLEKTELNLHGTSPRYESPYGTVPLDSPFYIERYADQRCLSEFLQVNRGTTFIQAPRQMGKSSLMQRTLHKVKAEEAISYAFIDFHRFQEKQLANSKDFLITFCKMLRTRFGIAENVEKYWSDSYSDLDNCSFFVQSIVSQMHGTVIIALDEVDRVLGLPWQNDFFGMLRTWHDEAAYEPDLKRLRLFLSASTEPHLFIKNPDQSPFNVVSPIELDDFSLDQLFTSTQKHRVNLTSAQVNALYILLNGHPCLTRISLYHMALKHYDFNTLLINAASNDGPFGDHLKHLRNQLTKEPESLSAVRQICRGRSQPIDNIDLLIFFRLKGAGLVKSNNSQVVMRNQLYEQYFKRI